MNMGIQCEWSTSKSKTKKRGKTSSESVNRQWCQCECHLLTSNYTTLHYSHCQSERGRLSLPLDWFLQQFLHLHKRVIGFHCLWEGDRMPAVWWDFSKENLSMLLPSLHPSFSSQRTHSLLRQNSMRIAWYPVENAFFYKLFASLPIQLIPCRFVFPKWLSLCYAYPQHRPKSQVTWSLWGGGGLFRS